MKLLLFVLLFTYCTAGVSDIFKNDTLYFEIKKQIKNISTKELSSLLVKKPDTFLIDVRTRADINMLGGEIRALNNYNVPRGWIELQMPIEIKKDSKIIVYCGIGYRSVYATKTLMKMGYTNVINYEDGFNEWDKQNLPKRELDKYHSSILYSPVTEVIEDVVYTSIGATAPANYENSGHNNNLSFVITKAGVIVFNGGASYLLAKSIHNEIKELTNQKVKYVVMENAQGHAALGMSYWQEVGAVTIMHKLALDEWQKSGLNSFARAKRVQKDKFMSTQYVMPDETFKDEMDLSMGGENIKIKYLGKSHGPGDIVLIMPDRRLVISGDVAFNERMLPIFKYTYIQPWLKTWKKFEALNPKIIIPGHGKATNLKTVTKFTKDYLVFLRTSISKLLDDDGGLEDISTINQSAYWNSDTFRELSMQNLATVFKRMEFE